MKVTPALLAAATRILTENGKFVTDGIGFAAPPEPFGTVLEKPDGSFAFLPFGEQLTDADFTKAVSVWADLTPVNGVPCAETSPEVAAIAAKGLAHPESLTPDEVKSICASALVQAPKAPD